MFTRRQYHESACCPAVCMNRSVLVLGIWQIAKLKGVLKCLDSGLKKGFLHQLFMSVEKGFAWVVLSCALSNYAWNCNRRDVCSHFSVAWIVGCDITVLYSYLIFLPKFPSCSCRSLLYEWQKYKDRNDRQLGSKENAGRHDSFS